MCPKPFQQQKSSVVKKENNYDNYNVKRGCLEIEFKLMRSFFF